MKSDSNPVMTRRRKVLALSAAGLLILYALTGFLVVPWAIESLLPGKLSAVTGRTVTLASAAFNPFTFEVTLEKFAVVEKNSAPFASVGRLYTNAEVLPLLIGKAVLRDLVIEQPAVSLVRDSRGRFNFADLIPAEPAGPQKPPPSPEKPLPAFLVENIAITAGEIRFADKTAGPGFSLTAAPFSVTVTNLGSREETPAHYRFEIATRSGAALKGEGTAAIADLTATGKITLSGLPLTQFEPYYRQFIKANIKSGRAGFGLAYRYPAGPDSPLPEVTDARVSLTNLVVAGPKGSVRLVAIPDFSITGIQLDPVRQTVRAGTARLSDPFLRVDRSKDGGIYLVEAFLPNIDLTRGPAAPVKETGNSPWRVRLDALEVDNLSLTVHEQSSPTPSVYSLEQAAFRVSGIEYDTGKMDGLPLVETAGATIRNLKIAAAEDEKAIIAIPEVDISGAGLDPFAGLASVAAVTTRRGAINLKRTANGELNLLRSLPAAGTPAERPDDPDPSEPAGQARLTAHIARVAVEDYTLSVRDEVPATPAVLLLDRISVAAGNISTAADEKASLEASLRWDEGGTLSAAGALTLIPLAGTIDVNAEKLEVTPVQPYLNEKIHVLLTGGDLNTSGRLAFRTDPDRGFMASFKGDTLVSNFTSLDKHLGKDFLRWKSLQFSGIDVDSNPLRVNLDEVALADFYARATVNADGTINLRTVLSPEGAVTPPAQGPAAGQPAEAPAPPTAEAAPAKKATAPGTAAPEQPIPPVAIRAITLQGGTVSFSDQLIEPHFETEMLELGGNISGLSSEELARADVFLAGRLENHSPLKITGQINPLTQNRYSDISIEFRDIDLSPFSPYTGKYIGYKLEKGKLTLVLNYRLSQNTLVAQNKIRFNRLTLGEKVESEAAVNLPIKLGLAILSDSEGNVELDLPVRGSVDDPEFSLGSIIFQAIVGLVTKTVSAPFAALGQAFGGGAELSYIEFEAGRAAVGPEQHDILTTLAAALVERPALNLEITGMVAPETDSVELRNRRYDDLLLAQQARMLYRDGQAPPEEERPAMSAEQRDTYITRAFEEADIPKPRNADGSLKKLSAPEMEKLLYTAITISAADLRQLAMERAEAAKDHLLTDERLSPERLYITEPVVDVPVDADEPPQSRVKFAIHD